MMLFRTAMCLALMLPGASWAGEWAVGFGAQIGPDPYVSGDGVQLLPLPVVTYTGERLTVSPGGVQFSWSLSPELEVSLLAGLRIEGFDADEHQALAGLRNRQIQLDAGVGTQWLTRVGVFQAQLLRDVSGRSNGFEVGAGYGIPLFGGRRWELAPSLQVQWKSRNLVDYYYGVSAAEATARFPEYRPNGSMGWEVGLDGSFEIGSSWRLLTGVGYGRLGSGVTRSPIVEDVHAWSGSLAAVRRFGKTSRRINLDGDTQ